MNLEAIKKIEGRTEEDVIYLLQTYKLRKKIRNKWGDYETAKRIIFEGQFIDCEIYDKQISWIVDYLGI